MAGRLSSPSHLNETLFRLREKSGYAPQALSMQVAVVVSDSGQTSQRYDVPMVEDPASWVWINAKPVTITGMTGIIDTALFYHAASDEPVMSMVLDGQTLVGSRDSITFEVGNIRLSGDAIAHFQWPPEDYMIEELEEP